MCGGRKAVLACNDPFALLITIVLSTRYASGHIGVVAGHVFPELNAPRGVKTLSRARLRGRVRSYKLCETGTGGLLNVYRVLVSECNKGMPRSFSRLIGLPNMKHGATGMMEDITFNCPTVTISARMFHMSGQLGLSINSAPSRIRRKLGGIVPVEG